MSRDDHGTLKKLVLCTLVVLFTAQCLGTASSDDRWRGQSGEPLQSQDGLPGGADEQAEVDGSQEEGELEFTLAQGSGISAIPRIRPGFDDSVSCPREAFDSDLFRPPTHTSV
jgi:hypothetical protein